METARRVQVAALLVCATALGCRSIDRYDTPGNAAYCGSLVGAPLFHEGFVATGARPDLGLRLKLTTATIGTRPGTLTSNDALNGFCSGEGHALFQDASLRAIQPMFHDTLSQLEFGEGHEHDFFAWVDSSCQGTMLAVVSLLTNGAVEMRLLKPAADPPPNAGPEATPGFAVFYFDRSAQGCGF